jgi:hypothetical protein
MRELFFAIAKRTRILLRASERQKVPACLSAAVVLEAVVADQMAAGQTIVDLTAVARSEVAEVLTEYLE